jgi:hypothetical protein
VITGTSEKKLKAIFDSGANRHGGKRLTDGGAAILKFLSFAALLFTPLFELWKQIGRLRAVFFIFFWFPKFQRVVQIVVLAAIILTKYAIASRTVAD